jgi:hypothetical protein
VHAAILPSPIKPMVGPRVVAGNGHLRVE